MLNGCWNLIVGTFNLVALSIVLSAFYSGCKWLLSLLSVCGAPTWGDFLYGGLGVFIVLFICTIFKVARMFKDDQMDKEQYDEWLRNHGERF